MACGFDSDFAGVFAVRQLCRRTPARTGNDRSGIPLAAVTRWVSCSSGKTVAGGLRRPDPAGGSLRSVAAGCNCQRILRAAPIRGPSRSRGHAAAVSVCGCGVTAPAAEDRSGAPPSSAEIGSGFLDRSGCIWVVADEAADCSGSSEVAHLSSPLARTAARKYFAACGGVRIARGRLSDGKTLEPQGGSPRVKSPGYAMLTPRVGARTKV